MRVVIAPEAVGMFAVILFLFGVVVVATTAGGPDCVVKFRVDRQKASLSMINEIRPEVRVEILDCGGHLRISEGGIP